MRVAYVRPFVSSARAILDEVVSAESTAGVMKLQAKPVASHGVLAIVGITGEGKGQVFYDMSAETAMRIASEMNGQTATALDDLTRDSLAELASMITGRAISTLNDNGHHLRVSPPTLIAGDGVTVSGLETLVVPLETSFGEVVVNVALVATEEG